MTTDVMQAADAATLTAKTVCLSVKGGLFGNSKQASLAGIEVDSDKTLLRLSKQLLASPELQAVSLHDGATGRILRSIGFPSMFRSGIYLISVAEVESTEAMLQDRATERAALVKAAVDSYPQRLKETIARLKDMSNLSDYPSQDRFAEFFYFEWSWIVWDTPTRLKAISADLFERERQKAQDSLAGVAEQCRQAMRAGLAKLVDHLTDRITPGDDGKPKRLDSRVIKNLNEFLTTFSLKDVTDDTALATLVEKARLVMEGVDTSVLKSDELIRTRVAAELTELSTALEPLIIDKGTRAISFDEEEIPEVV